VTLRNVDIDIKLSRCRWDPRKGRDIGTWAHAGNMSVSSFCGMVSTYSLNLDMGRIKLWRMEVNRKFNSISLCIITTEFYLNEKHK